MNPIKTCVLVLCLCLTTGVPLLAYAVDLQVDVLGQMVPAAGTGTDCVVLSGPGGVATDYPASSPKITIEAIQTAPLLEAKVMAGTPPGSPNGNNCVAGGDDTGSDTLRFLYAKIKPKLDAGGNAVPGALNFEHRIVYWGTFSDAPQAVVANSTSTYYKITGGGSFKRGTTGTTGKVRGKGYIQAADPTVWYQITGSELWQNFSGLGNPTAYFTTPYSSLSQLFPSPDIPVGADTRKLKVEFYFKFGHKLDELTLDANGLRLFNSATPGPGDVFSDDPAPPVYTRSSTLPPAPQPPCSVTVWHLIIVVVLFLIAWMFCCWRQRATGMK